MVVDHFDREVECPLLTAGIDRRFPEKTIGFLTDLVGFDGNVLEDIKLSHLGLDLFEDSLSLLVFFLWCQPIPEQYTGVPVMRPGHDELFYPVTPTPPPWHELIGRRILVHDLRYRIFGF